VTSLLLTREGGSLLVSTLDSTIRKIDLETGNLLQRFKGHVNEKYRIQSALADSEGWVVAGDETGVLVSWDHNYVPAAAGNGMHVAGQEPVSPSSALDHYINRVRSRSLVESQPAPRACSGSPAIRCRPSPSLPQGHRTGWSRCGDRNPKPMGWTMTPSLDGLRSRTI
jgi:hypothetical protein